MAPPFSVAEMTEVLAGKDATDAEKALLHRQIRNFHKKGFLSAISVRDDRGTAEFDTEALYKIRVLSALVGAGFDADSGVFRASVRAMSEHPIGSLPAPSQIQDGYFESLGGLRNAIRGNEFGEEWRLSFAYQSPYSHGTRKYDALFHLAADPHAVFGQMTGLLYEFEFSGSFKLNDIFAGLPVLSAAGA